MSSTFSDSRFACRLNVFTSRFLHGHLEPYRDVNFRVVGSSVSGLLHLADESAHPFQLAGTPLRCLEKIYSMIAENATWPCPGNQASIASLYAPAGSVLTIFSSFLKVVLAHAIFSGASLKCCARFGSMPNKPRIHRAPSTPGFSPHSKLFTLKINKKSGIEA